MTAQLLASISPDRRITHHAGQTVYIHWDAYRFRLSRARFGRFVRALEHGSRWLYAEDDGYSVVQVDDEQCNVWIENTCLTLNRREYRALLNAALRTETRLHGFRVVQAVKTDVPNHAYRSPRLIRHHWN